MKPVEPTDPTLDLEDRLRTHYRTMPADETLSLELRVADALELHARRRPALEWLGSRARLVSALAAAVVVVAVVLSPLWFGPLRNGPAATSSPTASGTAVAVQPTPSGRATSTPAVSVAPVPAPSERAMAEAQLLGRIRTGGVWAVSGSTLWWSLDPNSSHGMSPIPLPAADTIDPVVFVLDEQHAWSVTTGPGTKDPVGGNGPGIDHLTLVVNHSIGNLAAFQPVAIPGDYADSTIGLTFADAQHGYLVASGGHSSAGNTTILATSDGGTSWHVVTTVGGSEHGNLGPLVTASDDATLWAGAQCQDVPHPLLAVSRDGGQTWTEVALPGLAGITGTPQACLMEAPVFLDALTGFVMVMSDRQHVFGTTDGGRSWVEKQVLPDTRATTFFDATHWACVLGGGELVETADGGHTWTETHPRFSFGPAYVLALAARGPGDFLVLVRPNPDPGSDLLYGRPPTSDSWGLVNVPGQGPLSDQQLDANTAKSVAISWSMFVGRKEWPEAYALLSPFEQAQFGGEQRFADAMTAGSVLPGTPTAAGSVERRPGDLDAAHLGAGRLDAFRSAADTQRAYFVELALADSGGRNPGKASIIVAPLVADGTWRIWLLP